MQVQEILSGGLYCNDNELLFCSSPLCLLSSSLCRSLHKGLTILFISAMHTSFYIVLGRLCCVVNSFNKLILVLLRKNAFKFTLIHATLGIILVSLSIPDLLIVFESYYYVHCVSA